MLCYCFVSLHLSLCFLISVILCRLLFGRRHISPNGPVNFIKCVCPSFTTVCRYGITLFDDAKTCTLFNMLSFCKFAENQVYLGKKIGDWFKVLIFLKQLWLQAKHKKCAVATMNSAVILIAGLTFCSNNQYSSCLINGFSHFINMSLILCLRV